MYIVSTSIRSVCRQYVNCVVIIRVPSVRCCYSVTHSKCVCVCGQHCTVSVQICTVLVIAHILEEIANAYHTAVLRTLAIVLVLCLIGLCSIGGVVYVPLASCICFMLIMTSCYHPGRKLPYYYVKTIGIIQKRKIFAQQTLHYVIQII